MKCRKQPILYFFFLQRWTDHIKKEGWRLFLMSMGIELENMDYAVCGIKTAGLISGLVLGTGEAIRHREVITPNRSGLDKRTSRTHFRKKKIEAAFWMAVV